MRTLNFWISLLKGTELKLSHILYNLLHTGLPVLRVEFFIYPLILKKLKVVEETRSCAFLMVFSCVLGLIVISMCILILKKPRWEHFNTQLQALYFICHYFARCRSNTSDKKKKQDFVILTVSRSFHHCIVILMMELLGFFALHTSIGHNWYLGSFIIWVIWENINVPIPLCKYFFK